MTDWLFIISMGLGFATLFGLLGLKILESFGYVRIGKELIVFTKRQNPTTVNDKKDY